jgi:uncharacterized protein
MNLLNFMTKTALDLSPQEWKSYQPHPNHSLKHETERWKRGWQLAHTLAQQLRESFGAKKVTVFGSLLNPDEFHAQSDVDLAVLGIPPECFFKAVATVTGASNEFKVDLVDVEDCLPQLKEVIESIGIPV